MGIKHGIALVLWALSSLPTSGAEIKVLASTGVSAMFKQLIPQYEKASGHQVVISYDTSNLIISKIGAGQTADLVVLTAPLIDQLARQGKVQAGSRVDLAQSGIGVAVREGAPKPDIASVPAFRQTLLQVKSVAYTATGASGIYFANLTEKLGIAPEIRAKALTPAGGIVAELVAKGEAELCIQMISELKGVAGTTFLGPLPAELQLYTVFSAGLMANGPQATLAQELARYLSSPEALKVYEAAGMERVR